MVLDSSYIKTYKSTFRSSFYHALNKNDMHINTFQPVGGGHFWFLHFDALSAIFELGIQQIWVQHPSIPQKSLYAIN